MEKANKSNAISITRAYEAPLKAVWDAWTDPKQIAQWWGPRGFTITTHSRDLRVGGTWRYTMHGPDGVDYPNVTQYLEVEEYQKLVYDHGGDDTRAPMFRVTVLFSETGGKTKMEMTMSLATPEDLAEARAIIKQAGGNSTWDRLAEFLEKESTTKEIFVINRTFEAPRDRMFEMWINPEHLSQWMGPAGSTMKLIRSDIRKGGGIFYSMSGDNGTMYGKANYLEIDRPHKLVYTQHFCDEQENVSRHPMAPTWPETMLTRVVFEEESGDRTRVTVIWEVYGSATPEEVATFINGRSGMTQGWGGSFDRLDEYVASSGVKVA